MNGIIYSGLNNINQKRYIGSTTRSLEKRIWEHQNAAFTEKGGLFANELFLYGLEKFEFEIVDTAETVDELAQKEIYYISKYDTFANGYNSDRGGGFQKTIYQFDMNNPAPIASYQSLEEAGDSVDASPKTISNACLGTLKSAKGFLWSYTDNAPEYIDQRRQPVTQYDINGVMIQTFLSAREASRELQIPLSCITRCCRGEREQTHGFRFSY